jgi:uncharacterized membrane protein
MNVTGSSESSIVLPLLVLGLAMVAMCAAGGAVWLLLALGALLYLTVQLVRSDGSRTDTALGSRVDFLERRLTELQAALDQLRSERTAPAASRPERAPTPARAQAPPPQAAPPPPPAPPSPAPAPMPGPAVHARSFDWGRTISTADLLGAKALAFAGGIVTLLGVIFFFVLAVNRGWVGPGIRVACGGLASAIVVGAGLWLKRRYGTTYSALAAVGAGLAGAYATLLAATSLYDMVSKPLALVIAAAIASIGVAVSLAWSSEIVAGFGLIGAMIVPATLVFQGGLEQIGTAFVAVVFAGATVVAVRERWWRMLQVAALVSVPQALAQIADAARPDAGIVTLAMVFWLLLVAAGVAFQLRLGPALSAAPASLLTGGAVFAGVSAALLYGQRNDGLAQGIALLVAASVYGVVATVSFRRARELATLLWALGLTAAAAGLAEALSGSSLTYAWAAEAALLAWLATKVRDQRFQLPALVYLSLALLHVIAFEASPDHLFEIFRHPAGGAPALLAVALAALVFGSVEGSWDESAPAGGILRRLEPLLRLLRRRESELDASAFALAALLTVYAASLGILELFQAVWPGDAVVRPFDWGHVAVTAAWSIVGVAGVMLALLRRSPVTLWIGFAWLAATVLKVTTFDAVTLAHTPYAVSFLVVGASVLIAGLAREVASTDGLTGEGVGALIVSFALLVVGGVTLVTGMHGNGFVLVGTGGLYCGLAAAGFALARRDLSTLLWTLGLGAAAVGAGLLVEGVWLVMAYAVTAAALAAVSVGVAERRLQIAALVYLAAGAAVALVGEAPLSHLVTTTSKPGAGVPSLLLVLGGTAALAWALGWRKRYRLQALWTAGALGMYAASLSILEAVQQISPAGVHTDFQRGHTVVSAFWGLLALISLYLGLTRRQGLLRGGGFILFAISLGKIFLFDLPNLSSAQRALSFLAVGAILLLGGFFYQRLSAQFDERSPEGRLAL